MIIVYSPTEHACLWNSGKLPHDGYFRCNCFVKGDMWSSCDVQWKHRPEFCMLMYSPNKRSRKNLVRTSLINHSRSNHLRLVAPARYRDVNKHVNICKSDLLLAKHFLVDLTLKAKFFSQDIVKASGKSSLPSTEFLTANQVIEEPWLLQSSIIYHQIEDSDAGDIIANGNGTLKSFDDHIVKPRFSNPHGLQEDSFRQFEEDEVTSEDQKCDVLRTLFDYPVEEPWLVQPSILSTSSLATVVHDVAKEDVCVKEEDMQPATSGGHEQIPENPLADNGTSLISEEDSIATDILINSSICTMQRIAVLEDGKLVELLLEPVKNNVLCDSVYLGVVTKLVPHMGGAFVNIGCPRPSFMDIKLNREPFIFPPFHHQAEEGEVNGSPFSRLGAHSGVPGDKVFSTLVDETDDIEDDDVEDDDIEDNSVEYMKHEFVEHVYLDDSNVSTVLENSNGSIFVNGVKNGSKRSEKLSENELQPESHVVDYGTDSNNKVTGANGTKWAPVRKGTKIIVQVVKEGLGTKGPTLTAYPKLRSRFWILIARSSTIGISKKITGVERTRLRVIAKTLQPPGFGLTVRTVAAGHSLEELQKDLEGLLSTWKSIIEHARSAALASDEGVDGAIPVMLHRAMGKTLSVVQDYFTEKVKSMVVDSPRTYHEVTNYLQEIAPNLCDRVELYSKRTPLFDEYKIEEEIDSILSKRVPLDNGGYLVIEQTEALVSIDVNGGHCMLGEGTSQEKAILDVNLAAAKQIARELRLRDIGGIIVVDFIDMIDDSNKRLVYEEVKKAVERDRSTVKVSELSRHGLMEITRKRVRPSVTFMISEPCACCHGTGRVEALETSFSKIEHEICRMLSMTEKKADPENPKSWLRFILRVDRYMCNYLTSGKRTRLAVLSSSLKVWILLKVARGFTRGAFELKPLTDDKEDTNQNQLAIPLLRSTDVGTYTPSKKVALIPIKKWKTGGK